MAFDIQLKKNFPITFLLLFIRPLMARLAIFFFPLEIVGNAMLLWSHASIVNPTYVSKSNEKAMAHAGFDPGPLVKKAPWPPGRTGE